MKGFRALLSIAVLVTSGSAHADGAASQLVDALRDGQRSEGFEARLSAVVVSPPGHRSVPIKVAVIGQFDDSHQRLLIRAIAPEALRGRSLLAERDRQGVIRVSDEEGATVDPFAGIFGTGLVVWDMFSPWVDWSGQSVGSEQRVAGHDCQELRSRPDAASSGIGEVVSCVDRRGGLSLRTRLFDTRHALIRTIVATELTVRESGMLAAKRAVITASDHSATEVEAYSGDEHHAVSDLTFVPPPRQVKSNE